MEYERIVEIADLINSIVEYTVDRAVKSRNQAETYQWLLKMNADAEDSMAEIQELRQPVIQQQPSVREQIPVKPSSAIYPAVSFIRDYPREKVSMKEMADLCHLSPSYFSRLFNQETGESFVNYVNRQKIELAKEQLRGTSKSISQIAGELGYLNVSNFIAV